MKHEDICDLSGRIARCDLPRVLAPDEARAAVANYSALVERERSYGDLRWLTVKVKAAADEYGIPMQIPPEMADLYEGFQKDREIFSMPQPTRFLALWARRLGFRKSFYEAVR